MSSGSTSGLFFPVLSADGLHKAQTAINPYFGDGCVNPRRSTQRAAFHLGSRYTATRCAPGPGVGPAATARGVRRVGTERASRSARGCGPSLGGRSPSAARRSVGFLSPRGRFFSPYLAESRSCGIK